MAFDSYFYARFFLSCIKCRISLYIRSSRFVSAGLNYLCESRLDREALCHESEGEEEQLHDYRPSTSFSFCFRENWFSPSVVLSLATQVLSSVTVLSNSCHSLTRVSTLATQSSATDLTFMYLSLRAATSSSASLWVVIFLAAESAASKTLRWSTQAFSKPWTFSARAEASSRLEGLLRPSVEAASALTSQGENSLMPVLYSAQNLTSSEYLSHSFLVFSWRSVTYLVILLSSSLNSWASAGTLSP